MLLMFYNTIRGIRERNYEMTTAKAYRLTKRGEVVLAVCQGIAVVALGYATLHITASIIIWLGQTFFGY
jgi:predicted methyltransferase